MNFENKTVLITGSSRNIGKHLAQAFANKGANVIINYLEHYKEAIDTKKEIDIINKNSIVIQADVRKLSDVEKMIDEIIEKYNSIDILINNAGISIDNIIWKMNENDWNNVIDTNLKGSYNCMRTVIPFMREKNYGRIINISSVVSEIGVAGTSSYAAAKSGLFGLTKSVAREVANRNITVNAIALGYFNIGMGARLSEKIKKEKIEQIPMGRFGNVEEIINPILFISSEGASYITGQLINVNGGYY